MNYVEAMKQALRAHKKNERHRTVAETRYWCDQYKLLAEQAIAAIAEAEKQEPVAWKHDCAALLQNDVELWVDRCPHCGKPSTTPPAAQPAPVQEPVFWYRPCADGMYEGPVHNNSVGGKMLRDEKPDEWKPLYTTPPAAQWVGLTDEEKEQATGWSVEHIEQALKEKNSGNQDGCSHAALPAADDLIATYEKGFKDGAAQRQPLTDEEIKKLAWDWKSGGPLEFARAIETAHGITGEKT